MEKTRKRWRNEKDQPGAADLSFFDRYDAGERLRSAIPELKGKTFLQCFNDWPDFMSVPLKGRGTPLEERFDEAAELAAAYVADQIADAGYTSTWWEVKNESSVKSEWDHHFAKGKDGWGLLADFHNRTADAIHAKAPGVKVGGPSSAYMQFQVQDFTLYRSQARFIEETRGHLDFFSHHFYENLGMLGAHARRGFGLLQLPARTIRSRARHAACSHAQDRQRASHAHHRNRNFAERTQAFRQLVSPRGLQRLPQQVDATARPDRFIHPLHLSPHALESKQR